MSCLATFPVAAPMVSMIWTLRRRRPVYPYATDVFVTRPALIDTTGNSLDLYDMIEWWDDANQLVSRVLLSAGVVWLGGDASNLVR